MVEAGYRGEQVARLLSPLSAASHVHLIELVVCNFRSNSLVPISERNRGS